MENTRIIITLEEQFAEECQVIDIRAEYSDFSGEERYIIASDLTKEELEQKYAVLLDACRPFVLVGTSYAEIRNEYRKNEHKHNQRMKRGSQFDTDDDFCEHHPEQAVPDFTISLMGMEDSPVHRAIETLPPAENRRIRKKYFAGYSHREIAKQEGVSESAISQSIKSAEAKIRNYLLTP